MKFSIGDKVLLKRTGEEGRIISFLSKTMMEVEVSGTCFPVYNEDVDHPYLKWFTEKKKAVTRPATEIPVEKPALRAQRLSRGIYLSFIPQYATSSNDDIIELFKIHLVNETPEGIDFTYDVRSASGKDIFRHSGQLHAFGHLYLHPVTLEELNEQPRYHWQASTAGRTAGAKGSVRIRPAQLVRYIREMQMANNPSFSILLSQDAETMEHQQTMEPEKAVRVGRSMSDIQTVLHTVPEPVIDLHVTLSAGKNGKAYSAAEILQLQLGILERKLDAATIAGLPQLVVIHGIGNGTLKQAVHQTLSDSALVARFSNHWMSKYGWGATEVFFKQE